MNDLEIIPLGTVSPYCKGKSNCVGFLIKYNDKKILLDCGNGIARLMSFPVVLDNLNVFISHFHDDHFGDVGCLQYASYVYHNLGFLNNRVNIYLPKDDFRLCKQKIINNEESYCNYFDVDDNICYFIDDLKVSFRDNKSHTINSYMIKLENNEVKIVYTSDIGNTNIDDIVDFSYGSDLFICESSFIIEHNISSKTHLTAREAGKIASLSKCKKLLLTHFWPETDKLLYLNEARKEFDNVDVSEERKKILVRCKNDSNCKKYK